MKLTDYVRRILHRWRVIVCVLAVVVGAVMAITLTMTPVYESTARVFVSNSAEVTDVSDQIAAAQYAQQKVYSYAAVASSAKMASAVIQDLGLTDSPETVARKITTSVGYGTVIVTINVDDQDPHVAKRIADAVVGNYNDVLDSLDSREGKAPITVSLLEYPSLPNKPIKPDRGLNFIAALAAGLLLGVAAAALRDVIDDSAKGEDSLAEAGLSLLGTIPVRGEGGRRGKGQPDDDSTQLVTSNDRSPVAEAFRQLRLSIQFARVGATPHTLLVTSPSDGEGKSFVSANLGAVYADAGMRVLLVDLDLRRPSLARRLHVVNQVGLMNVLVGSASLESAIQQTGNDGLFLLPTGPLPPNPADVLASPMVDDLLIRVASDFDVVIIDSPPAGLFVDARELASIVDGIIVVARNKTSRVRAIAETVKQLTAVSDDVFGVVMNFGELQSSQAQAYDSYYDRTAATPDTTRPTAGRRRSGPA